MQPIFTGRNEVLAKVIFSQACVCPQGGCAPDFALIFWGGAPDFALIFWGWYFFGGGYFFWGGVFFSEGGYFFGGGMCSPPEYGQRSAGTHPTGMHSC